MNRKTFEWCVRFFSENLAARYTLHFVYKILPLTLFIAYPSLLVYAFLWQRQNIRMLTIVPLGVFIAITLLRLIVNEQRPYERYGKPSVFNKTTKGKSFPSRHTASAFIIAMAFMYESVPLGIAAMVISLLIEISRILSGAHYIHDVVAGMAFSVIAGYVFFFMI